MRLDDELNDLSPWLRDLRRQDDGLRTPDGYFDRLEDDVFRQLDTIGARRRAVTAAVHKAWWQRWLAPRPALAFATALVLVAAAWWWQRSSVTPPATSDPASAAVELTPEEAEAYLLENAAEFDPDYLARELRLEEAVAADDAAPPAKKPRAAPATPTEEDLAPLLDEMTDEELEDLLQP